MEITPTAITGVMVVALQQHGDERGFFARTFCAREFTEAGMPFEVVQANTSYSASRGTLRGFHYQHAPFAEHKLVRCTRGSAYDVALDIDPQSPTYLQHIGIELSQDNRLALLIPPHCAHAFLTLEDNTEMHYMVSQPYAPEHESGLRHDDPQLAITWPIPVTTVSEKDRLWPDL